MTGATGLGAGSQTDRSVPARRPRGPLAGVPTAVLAAATLVVAFAAVQVTHVRGVGGAVLVVGVVWCAWRALPAAGWSRVAAVVVLGALCFAASHVAAPALGPWPAVLLAAAVLAAGTAALVDRRR